MVAMWVDATVAAGFLTDPTQSQIVDDVGFVMAPYDDVEKGYHWAWSWAYAIPQTRKSSRCAPVPHLGNQQGLHQSSQHDLRLADYSPGTRELT